MQRLIHTSFENHAALISGADLEARMLRLYEPYWLMRRVDDGPVSIQHAVEGSGFLTEGVVAETGWGLLLQSEGEPILVNGKPLTKESVAVLPPGAEFRFVGHGPTAWTSVFVPNAQGSRPVLASCGRNSISVDSLKKPFAQSIVRRISDYLTNTEQKIDTGYCVEGQFGESVLTDALDLLTATEKSMAEDSRRTRNRTDVLNQAVKFVNESANGVLSVRDLAIAIDVSDRSLLTAFRQHVGITPQAYLLADRLHRARRLLQSTGRDETTIASIATQFGFLDFGRFAAKYRAIFGELPSSTLNA